MKQFEFDRNFIETKFLEAEMFLFDKQNVYQIKYDNFDKTTFDKFNFELLRNVSNKYIVYCLWLGDTQNDLKPKYVGHAKNTISRQRIGHI